MEQKNKSRRKTIQIILIILGIVMFLTVACVSVTLLVLKPTDNRLNMTLSEPLSNITDANIIIDQDDGNLFINETLDNAHVLVSGNLQYFEKMGAPKSVISRDGNLANFSLTENSGRNQSRLPWSACNGTNDWEIHLNPQVSYDISTKTDGGNVTIDLTGLSIKHLNTETGAGMTKIVLPNSATNLDVNANVGAGEITIVVGESVTGILKINAHSGAGEVTVLLPDEIAASFQVKQGQISADARFIKINENTYETSNYAEANDRVEMIVGSGVGMVTITSNLNIGSTLIDKE